MDALFHDDVVSANLVFVIFPIFNKLEVYEETMLSDLLWKPRQQRLEDWARG